MADREFSDEDKSHLLHHLGPQELLILHATSLSTAIISTISVLAASYWFIRMRRGFRHDLIMVVLQTDVFKSIWFVLYPIVALARGPVSSKSAFCQISGFFLTVSIEACDIAIALIAAHTALYIVRGHNGLYPYRKVAYAAFVCLPLLLTSLAFIDGPGFVNSGEFCYLPMKADWSGRALSWIPRYVIFVTLVITYAAIYLYVAFVLDRSGAAGSGRPESGSVSAGRGSQRRGRRMSLPPTPPIAYHGLIPSTPPPSRPETPEEERRNSSWTVPIFERRLRKASASLALSPREPSAWSYSVKWKLPAFGLDSANSSGDPEMPARCQLPSTRRQSMPSAPPAVGSSPVSARGFWHRSIAVTRPHSRAPSQPNILAVLRQGPNEDYSRDSSSLFLSTAALEETGMNEKRDKILQNTRLLFVYPAVYLAVWFFPLLSHVLGSGAHGAPFAIVLLGLISMTLHGACDALVFCWKEHPWQHIREESEQEPLNLWTPASTPGANPNVGRTQEEMRLDQKIARRRRNEEMVELRLGRLLGPSSSLDWWDRMQEEAESSDKTTPGRQ
ncbi:G protein-coupled glucose receptor regulating gpa2 domain-containing protein [Sarocladium implicatum]|nr:G protein-coupled glucose receptor regulating gpa2 domain-containing protein [Sarocladium implicatum]